MLKKSIYLLIIVLFGSKVFAQKELVLVNNGTSNYQIILPADANDIEKQSASVLQDYIQKISNFKLPILQQSASTSSYQIIIGRNKFISQSDISGLGGDGFIIRKVNNSLILTGGSRKGVLYSVYTLLEDYLGCRMYTSTAVYIPHASSVTLPSSLSRKEVPSFQYRMTFFPDAFNNNYCDFHKTNYYEENWGLWVHSFEVLVPKDKYFQSHPEYFALVNGKRNPAQLCLTNPDVLNLVIQNLQNLMKAKPNVKYWSVSQNDNEHFCECDNCKRLNAEQGSYQGSILTFVNNVAKHFPDKTISTLAYRKSENPPKTLKPLSNVLIMLCTTYDERRIPLKEQTNNGFNQNFKNWAAITSNLFIWDYIVQFVNSLSPFPNFYTMQSNVQYFATRDVTDLFLEGVGHMEGEFSELRCYMASRLMWNKDVDIKQTMNEFIDGYYGKNGGKYVSQYIDLLERNASIKHVGLRSGGTPTDAMYAYLSPDNISVYKRIFEDAMNATAGTVYHDRVMKEYLPVLYAELEINKTMMGTGRINFINKEADGKLLDDFYKKMKQLNIVYLNEARLKVDDYYKNYNNLLNKVTQ
ncbi:DUF4838 domain-containing protein [Segetibacter koreensis]|uniref:DUF4838 domain-containing protein n=1 Tax=Segetibacter koreensis TaxID=398037 RepID=UPI00037FDC30|nr:DUF4838 domain-containing protein [Segetibacter koreensis]